MSEVPERGEVESTPSEQVPPSSAKRRRLAWKPISEGLAAVAGLAGILALIFQIWPVHDEGQQGTTAVTTSASPAPEPGQETPTTDTGTESVAPGDCLDASLGSRTRCDAPHGYEVFASDGCDIATLIAHLGGDPAIDVIRALPERRQLTSGHPVCVVSPPEGAPGDIPAQGVLQGPLGDAWRSCIDDRTRRQDISCAEQHTGEWVSYEPALDGSVVCEEIAARYMNAPLSRFTGRLQIGTARETDGPRCFVTVLGGDLLHGSVRNIGTSSLPTR